MLNAIPVLGWLLSFILNVSLAVPFWVCWTVCGLGAVYFSFLPAPWQAIPFWHCVGLFIVLSIVRGLVPPIASASATVNKGER